MFLVAHSFWPGSDAFMEFKVDDVDAIVLLPFGGAGLADGFHNAEAFSGDFEASNTEYLRHMKVNHPLGQINKVGSRWISASCWMLLSECTPLPLAGI